MGYLQFDGVLFGGDHDVFARVIDLMITNLFFIKSVGTCFGKLARKVQYQRAIGFRRTRGPKLNRSAGPARPIHGVRPQW